VNVPCRHPELPFVVVRILVHVLLDSYRAIRRRLGEFRIDLVTSGWTRQLRGGRANAADADTADNKQADQRCSNLHFLAPLTRSAISRACPYPVHRGQLAVLRKGVSRDVAANETPDTRRARMTNQARHR
jgi:hypothetical protein